MWANGTESVLTATSAQWGESSSLHNNTDLHYWLNSLGMLGVILEAHIQTFPSSSVMKTTLHLNSVKEAIDLYRRNSSQMRVFVGNAWWGGGGNTFD